MSNALLHDQQREHLVVLDVHRKLFFNGSRTFYYATLFFPRKYRNRVTLFYAFVRHTDNIVDILQDRDALENLYQDFKKVYEAIKSKQIDNTWGNPIINAFVALAINCSFEEYWIEAFFQSMRLDFIKSEYNSQEEIAEYMYGSAEVIGLCMVRIMCLSDEFLDGARMLGRAMQHINFLRDIAEDTNLGRRYIPLERAPFASLREDETRKHPQAFEAFIRMQIRRFTHWQKKADRALADLPFVFYVPIRTATDMYCWTANRIYRNPWLVYKKVLKPGKERVILRALFNLLTSASRHWRVHLSS